MEQEPTMMGYMSRKEETGLDQGILQGGTRRTSRSNLIQSVSTLRAHRKPKPSNDGRQVSELSSSG